MSEASHAGAFTREVLLMPVLIVGGKVGGHPQLLNYPTIQPHDRLQRTC